MAGTGNRRPALLQLRSGQGPWGRRTASVGFWEGRGQAGTPRQAGGGQGEDRNKERPQGRMTLEREATKESRRHAPGTGMKKAPTVARRRLTLPAWKGQTGN